MRPLVFNPFIRDGLIMLAFIGAGIAFSSIERISPLDPTIFRLPSSAKEIVSERTDKAATFELSPHHFVAVSSGDDMFVLNALGQRVAIEYDGRQTSDRFAFDHLPQGVHISFDLKHPAYTYQQGKHHFTVQFLQGGKGIVENGQTVAYKLNDRVTMRLSVEKTNIRKEILVMGPGPLPDLSFKIIPDKNLNINLSNNFLQFIDSKTHQTIYTMPAPFLMDNQRNKLERTVNLIRNGDIYRYNYSTKGLPYPYIIDPSSGPNSPATVSTTATGCSTVTWTNPNNIKVQDGVYATNVGVSFSSSSNCIEPTNYGFSIPTGSAINGIAVSIVRHCDVSGTDHCRDVTVAIIQGGVVGSTNKGVTTTDWPTSDGTATYGNSSDLWGLTWAASDINSSNFGMALEVSHRDI